MNEPDYPSVRHSIQFLIESNVPEWEITKISGETALDQLNTYEKEGWPCPKIFIESEGVTFTWIAGDFKIYQHFLADTKESEFYVFLEKKK